MKVFIGAGGTGGHVFPALAIAQQLIAENNEVVWFGTKNGIESKVVPAAGILLHYINSKPLRGKGLVGFICGFWGLLVSLWQVFIYFRCNKPDVVLVMGGYAAAALGIVAKLYRIKLVLHEQNAKAGLCNRFLFYLADKVALGFAGAFVGSKVKVVGNPVRPDIVGVSNKSSEVLHCLVLGGSQGAEPLNQKISKAWLSMPREKRPKLWHQVGEKNKKSYLSLYNNEAQVSGFIENMSQAYAWADVIIARSGAMTVAECLAVGKPVAWVPYPYAADNHQYFNALAFLEVGNGWLWLQEELTQESIIDWWGMCVIDYRDYHPKANASNSIKLLIDLLEV